jgi:hypothetical protein
MFSKAPAVEPAPEVIGLADVIPLSHLELDLPTPVEGWSVFLAARGIEVTLDDIGRMAVARVDARRLLTVKRDREAEQARRRKLAEAKAVADDQIRRSQIWGGIPADHMPPGVTPAAVMLQNDRDAQPKRTTPLEHALSNSGSMEYHAYGVEGEAS